MNAPEMRTPPNLGRGGGVAETNESNRPLSSSKRPRTNQALIATIDKSHSVISGIYFQAGPGVTIPIEKLEELIAALKAVRP